MIAGPSIITRGLVFSLDSTSQRCVSPTANSEYVGAPQMIKNIMSPSMPISALNSVMVSNVNYYTAFGISYPEGSYGGDAAGRNGITPGFNVRGGAKTYDTGRALNFYAWDNNTNNWIADGYFHGSSYAGHCYDNYGGGDFANELIKFVSDYYSIKNTYPNSTFVVIGSHACSMFSQDTINVLQSLGAPNSISNWLVNDGSWKEFVLVGKPGLGAGNAYGWSFENYTTDSDKVAHLVFPLPIFGKTANGFYFDGTNNRIQTSYAPQFGDFTICLVFKDYGSGMWGRIVDKSYWNGVFVSSYFGSGGVNYVGAGIIEPNYPHGQSLPYTPGQYHFFTLVRSGAVHTIYLDGITQTSSKIGSGALLDATSFAFGDWSGANNQPYYGLLPLVNIYDRSLTTSEIQQNYLAVKTRFNIS